jgi:hypothetical protein
LNTWIPFIYIYMIKTHQQYLEHLPYWWCDGTGNNIIMDRKWRKMYMLEILYLRWYRPHVVFPCPKVAFRKRLPQLHKKGLGHGLNTQIPFIYA